MCISDIPKPHSVSMKNKNCFAVEIMESDFPLTLIYLGHITGFPATKKGDGANKPK